MTVGFTEEAVRGIAARAGEPEWFLNRRLAALKLFESLEWPDPGSEEWRYTDLKGFDLDALGGVVPDQATAENLDGVDPAVLGALGDVGDRDGLAIQVDGTVVHHSLSAALREKGVIFTPLSDAARDHPELVEEALGSSSVSPSEEKHAALGTAFGSGGIFLYVPRGIDVTLPIQSFRWLASPSGLSASRTIIVADEASSVTYIDHHDSPATAGAAAASLSLVEIHARQAANVSYLAVQDHADHVWHFHIQRAHVGRDATLNSLAATLGGRFSRSVVDTILAEQGASAEMLGVYFADGDQHFDHRSLQEHAAPSTTSELTYKGALKGTSRAVYSGLIHIAKDAPKSNANQTNRNLVLSDHAKADSIPYLEIENNDVRCGHGASVGPPDENQVFYLRSRGLDAKAAEDLIVRGYFQEILDRVRVPEVRAALENAVEEELRS